MRIWKYSGIAAFWLTWPLIWIYLRITPARSRVLVICDGKILLVGSWLGPGKWSLPGGGIDSHETPVHAAIRELEEELRLSVDEDTLIPLGLREVKGNSGLVVKHYLFAAVFESVPIITPAPYEIMEYKWQDVDDVAHDNKVLNSVVDALAAWRKAQNLL